MQNSDDIEMEPYDVATFREFTIPGFTINNNEHGTQRHNESKTSGSYQETSER
jgi:hypothetical protein